ncbi:YolD-like family protein [Desertibacillus haloalkaliphilus]|uniref:YolD-like family protein n=1 Tax=Desertibacillus haloalkaliphilus TaxID=1328930 RepID=UPI001C25527C|nr:YolD-like family protein [Desertibacillus haloalkaliphilus]MBU8908149.1 YolD-like family protein [Desertibacillus haloalkaliphilus]
MNEELRRGNILWESSRMFLPEHKEALMKKKLEKKEYTPPELDEDQFEEMNRILMESIELDNAVTVTYTEQFGETSFWGWVTKVDPVTKTIKLINDEDHLILSFDKIIEVD